MADYDISKITLDSGDVCNLKDSNLRGATVSVIEGDTASKAYNIGDVLVKGSNAYIVKQAIAAGDTLTAGTNITNVYTLANLERRLMSDFAPIQEGDTATIKHSVGDYLIMHGTLYKVTAVIAVGDTLTVGTNITAANLGAQLASEVSRAKSAESKIKIDKILSDLGDGWYCKFDTTAANQPTNTYVTHTIGNMYKYDILMVRYAFAEFDSFLFVPHGHTSNQNIQSPNGVFVFFVTDWGTASAPLGTIKYGYYNNTTWSSSSSLGAPRIREAWGISFGTYQ